MTSSLKVSIFSARLTLFRERAIATGRYVCPSVVCHSVTLVIHV